MKQKIIKIGVIGGLGPLASASFVETIYTSYLHLKPKLKNLPLPYVYLYSEPLLSQVSPLLSVADSETELLDKLGKNLSLLTKQGVDTILLCCFSAHALISKLAPEQAAKIYSLVSFVLEQVIIKQSSFKLLCASSTREIGVLEAHPLWAAAAAHLTFLGNEEQQLLDTLIKAVKEDLLTQDLIAQFLDLVDQLPRQQLIISCSELHVLHKKLISAGILLDCLFDPFFQITQNLGRSKP